MQTLIASIFVFGVLIFVHEVGHYLLARWSGIKVLELAIGFGPRIVSWRKNETDYSLRLFPLGGFCRMLGESPDEVDDPDSFPRKPVLHRAAVLTAGAVMNLLLAVLVFFIIFFFMVGTQRLDTSLIGVVTPDGQAETAGLEAGDDVISINGENVERWDEMAAAIERRPAEETRIVVRRNGEIKEFTVVPAENPDTGKGMIGIHPPEQRYLFFNSLGVSLDRFGMVIYSIFQVVTGQAPLDVAGPVGIINIIGEVAQTGFVNLLWLTGVISISLGIVNLLPIPALDGGRLLFLAIEAVRGRPLDPEKEGFIHFIGFAILIILILLVTYNDLIRLDIFPGR